MNTDEEWIKQNDHIPDDEVRTDIVDTQKEIDDFNEEIELYRKRNNPQRYRVLIYALEGRIKQRQDFIDKLKLILEYRRKRNEN